LAWSWEKSSSAGNDGKIRASPLLRMTAGRVEEQAVSHEDGEVSEGGKV